MDDLRVTCRRLAGNRLDEAVAEDLENLVVVVARADEGEASACACPEVVSRTAGYRRQPGRSRGTSSAHALLADCAAVRATLWARARPRPPIANTG
jgi:hypothetical protein